MTHHTAQSSLLANLLGGTARGSRLSGRRRVAALVGISALLTPSNVPTVWAGPPFSAFVNPAGGAAAGFGTHVVALSTGNVVVTAPLDDTAATNAGAVYLFNGATGALISTITGTQVNDQVGSGGVTALNNGNFVILSPRWANGATADVGAATWGSGVTGISGAVSSTNSLIGSLPGDFQDASIIASTTMQAANPAAPPTRNFLSNANYLVLAPNWDNLTVLDAGAVALGSGTAGLSGPVSAANSLIGSKTNDMSGAYIRILAGNGNYIVGHPFWDDGAVMDVGGVTWGSGATGVVGPISASKALVGSSTFDTVGYGLGVDLLTNGHYVVLSPYWDGGLTDLGAATWGNGTTGVVGAISASNSLVGSKNYDTVGVGRVTALTNGNYVVRSQSWDSGAIVNAGAATWGNGATGINGTISTANSLIGSTNLDEIGFDGVTALTNGNYVVVSSKWDKGVVTDAGAVTWGDGTAGVMGVVSDTNSLVGSQSGDFVGHDNTNYVGVWALTNGNYVVASNSWANGLTPGVGAVTWGSGTSGITGPVSAANSLVGTTSWDQVGSDEIIALTNGNYVVLSSQWTNGAVAYAGAATFGLGTGGTVGPVSASNSLVGTTANDYIGRGGNADHHVQALTNGNYVVLSPSWTNGAATDVGAVTFGSGVTGITGPVTTLNSLVGSTIDDQVGYSGARTLTNGNFVVRSPYWTTVPRVTRVR